MKTIPLCVGLALFGLLATATAQAQFFTSDTVIGSADTNYDGDDIVVLGCTLTVNGTHTFSDMLLVDGATLTSSLSTNGLDSDGPAGANLSVQNNVVIDDTSAIQAEGLNSGGEGIGPRSEVVYPPGIFFTGGGGGHGGYGGLAYGGAFGGQTYGNLVAIGADEMGSSGGSVTEGPGGSGGGYVSLTVGGAILVDGVISAAGADGTNAGSGGGSGGSISLIADSIVGAGSISANGGAGEGFDGGGGGGGRIVLNCRTNGLTGAITAYGGQGNVGGGAGTVYIAISNATPLLVVDNNGIDGTNTPLTLLTVPTDLLVTNGAVAETPLAGTLPFALQNLIVAPGSGIVANLNGNVSLSVSGNALIASNAGIFADGIYSGTVDAGSTVAATFFTAGGGGGNGGFGGLGASGATGGNSDYLVGIQVAALKSGGPGGDGGGGPLQRTPGGNGGGVISINVKGTLTLHGTLSADGAEGVDLGSGGGAGGDIEVQAAILKGTGSIAANGGAGEGMVGGGGGGGRIFIYSPTNQFSGGLTAYGGAGFRAGGAGTILESADKSFASGALTVDAGGIVGTNTPIPTSNVRFGITLLNGAHMAVPGSLFFATNLFVGSNCILRPLVSAPNTFLFSVSPGGINIAPGGAISWDGGGGNLRGIMSGNTLSVNNILTGGGGAGAGDGGSSLYGAAGGGSQEQNIQEGLPGSGGAGELSGAGGFAGGTLQIMSTSPVVINGALTANGGLGATPGSGGGGGGSIEIESQYLCGSGVIAANGGASEDMVGGGGGGGRLLLIYRTNQFTGPVTAYGGAGGKYGGAGVVILEAQGNKPEEVILNNNGNRGTNTPLSGLSYGGDLVISNSAIGVFDGELSVQTLFIGSNSFLIEAPNGIGNATVSADVNATIQQGGGILANGTEALGSQGIGQGTSTLYRVGGFLTGSGGSHGGYGGTSISGATSGSTYDQVTQPSLVGSGGGAGVGGIFGGGAGGGCLSISVIGLLTLDGVISVNGLQGTNVASGGGSGGGIQLRASGLAGSGMISANGGSGALPFGGGGGGGIISLDLCSNLFTGAISAHGGPGFVAGGAGLVYFYPYISILPIRFPGGVQTPGLLIDNGGLIGTNTPIETAGSYNLQVSGGAIVQPGKGLTAFAVNNLLVESNGVVTQSPGQGLLTVAAGGNITIGPGGSIVVDGKGYLGGAGPEAGGWAKSGAGGGGGHGGKGGNGAYGALGGQTNGSLTLPQELGSGGGALTVNSPYSQGGGAVALSARQNIIIDGLISANGLSSRYPGAGGGAGGSVGISALTLSGDGVISANGGAGDPDLGGGGGGGRIAIRCPSNTFAGAISFLGGTGFEPGGIGTLFVTTNLQVIQPGVVEAPQVSAELSPATAQLLLKWAGSSAASYQLYYSTNLIDWSPYGDAVSGSDGTMSLSAPCDGDSKFFRVVPVN